MPNMNLSYYVIVIQDLSMSMDDKVLRLYFFYRRTVHFEFYVVHTPTNSLFINLVKSFNLH